MKLKKYKLGEIATVEISGVDKKSKENEIPVKLCNFTDVYHNWAITKEMEDSFMNATANKKEFESFSIRKGQVAFTKDSETRDDIGIPTYIADDFENVLLGYHTALVTPDSTKLSGKFLNAFMHTAYIKKYFENNASGSGQRYTLSTNTLNDIPIIAPDLQTQIKIGDLFSKIDSKIALNRRINTKLENIAKRLYDYWFVQFDFPDANGNPYKSSGGKMVWNDALKREIPEGWEVVEITKYLKPFVEKVSSKSINSTDKYAPIEVLPRKKMSFCEFAPIENAVSGLCKFYKKQILLSNRRIYFHKVCIAAYNGLTRDTVIVLNPVSNDNYGYAYQLVNDDVFIEFATRHSYGSEQPVFTWESSKLYKVLKPLNRIDKIYSKHIAPIIDTILGNEKETARLTALRDKLLPLLMNGQVEVA